MLQSIAKEIASNIRKELTIQGFARKDISVTMKQICGEYYIYIYIKKYSIDIDQIRKIAWQYDIPNATVNNFFIAYKK